MENTGSATPSLVIPHITLRRGEEPVLESELVVKPGGGGLSYREETDADRDERGVLWARCSQLLDGQPLFEHVHPLRQRQCMTRLACQACTGPASRTDEGLLFLLLRDDRDLGGPGAYEGRKTAQPPVCLEHARSAVGQCRPLMQDGFVALRAAWTRPYGVLGTLYHVHPRRGLERFPRPDEDEALPYQDPRIIWALASQLVVSLHDTTVVDLDKTSL